MRRLPVYLCLLVLFAACQKVYFDRGETDEDIPENLIFTGTGLGTPEAPFTVDDILNGNMMGEADECWVIGYVVGATYSAMKNALFKPKTFYDTNILLSTDSVCDDPSLCIPIELTTKAMKEDFSLAANPERFRKCLLIKGWPALYFKVNGLRRVSAGYWLGDFDIKSILNEPEEWKLDTIPMR